MASQFTLKVGDIRKIKPEHRGACCAMDYKCNIYVEITKVASSYYYYNGLDKDKVPTGYSCYCCYNDSHLELTNSNSKSFMENIVTFAKNLVLSADEKSLREAGLKNNCGEYTAEAKEIIMAKLMKDNEAYLITITAALKAEKADK